MTRFAVVAVFMLVLVGCAGDDGTNEAEITPDATEVVAYFTRLGRVWPVRRVVSYTENSERAALDALVAGPTDREFEELGLRHAIRSGADVQGLVIENGVARVEATDELREDGLAQIVFTLTQFPEIESVEIVMPGETRRLARSDFESLTPAILVESPLAYEAVTSPLRVTVTTEPEASFTYEVRGGSGVLTSESVLVVVAGGARVPVGVDVPFDVAKSQRGMLVVYEYVAEDDRRINVQKIPLWLSP